MGMSEGVHLYSPVVSSTAAIDADFQPKAVRDFCVTSRDFYPFALLRIVSTGPRESVADTLFAASISNPSSAPE